MNNVMTVKYHFAFQLIFVLLNLIMLHHDDYNVTGIQELIQIMHLIRNYVLHNKWIIGL